MEWAVRSWHRGRSLWCSGFLKFPPVEEDVVKALKVPDGTLSDSVLFSAFSEVETSQQIGIRTTPVPSSRDMVWWPLWVPCSRLTILWLMLEPLYILSPLYPTPRPKRYLCVRGYLIFKSKKGRIKIGKKISHTLIPNHSPGLALWASD